MILTDPSDSDQHVFNTVASLICIIEYAPEVDTSVLVHASWNSNKTMSLENNTRITFTEEGLGHTFTSTLTINALLLSDSDVYTCIANVLPEVEYSTTVVGNSFNEEFKLTVRKSYFKHIFYVTSSLLYIYIQYYRSGCKHIHRVHPTL